MIKLPFTTDQFFGIFGEYNRAFWVAALALWIASALVSGLVWRTAARSRILSFFLAALWLWNALAYHAWLFTRINPAAWLFAALFAAEALLFARAGLRNRIEYFSASGPMQLVGVSLMFYALAYPLLTIMLGHGYPATPTFGVPCPTTILTIGVLMTGRGAIPVTLAIIPVVWGLIGGSAAALLDVPTDYVLLAAGVLLAIRLVVQRIAPRLTVAR